MASGKINDSRPDGILFITQIDVVTVSLETEGDHYVDVDTPTAPTGYMYVGSIGKCGTYKLYVKGISGGRIYYYVSVAASLNTAITLTHLYKKIS